MPSKKIGWDKEIEHYLIESGSRYSGATTLALIVVELLCKDITLNYDSFREILINSLSNTKNKNAEHYVELLLALSFFDKTSHELLGISKESNRE